jgi:hypothetical protein
MDRIELGPLVAVYGLHSRSLRVLRGLAGNGVLVVVVGPCVVLFVLPFLSSPADAVILAGVLLAAMWLGLMAIASYESLAAGSLSAIRCTIVVALTLAASRLALVGIAVAESGWELAWLAAMGMVLNLAVLWLVVQGLLPLAWRDRQFERDLFRAPVRERSSFFLPFASLAGDMCRMAGLVVPPHRWRADGLTAIAALAAFGLEGSVYYAYLQAGFNFQACRRAGLSASRWC